MSNNHAAPDVSQQTDAPSLDEQRPASPIQHVFVLMLENHSFDNMLAFSGIDGLIAATPENANAYNGVTYPVSGSAPPNMPTDPGHQFTDVVEQLAGPGVSYSPGGTYPPINNAGFLANYATTQSEGRAPPAAKIQDIMQTFDTKAQLPVLYQLATEFVVCDQWFSSMPGPTWPNRLFLHGASSNGLDDAPSTSQMAEWETVDGFRYPNGSIFDALNARKIPWRLYHDTDGPIEGAISLVSALHGIELSSVHELSRLASDVQSGTYPYQYTFIEPNYGDVLNGTYEGGSSQHPMDGVGNGETLIKSVYEAIRNSPVWNASLLIITYDEHGGFYDHYAPPPAPPPDDGGMRYSKHGFTFSQYGVRVPAVIVSPWVAAGVDHTLYDHTSVLSTLSWLFGLPPLTQRDARANPLRDVLRPLASPRTDCPTELHAAVQAEARVEPVSEPPAARTLEPIPGRSSAMGFLGVLLKADSMLSADAPGDRAAARARFQNVKTREDARHYVHEVMTKVQAAKAKR